MRYDDQDRESRNVEDRRGQRLSGGAMKLGGAGILIAIVVAFLKGGDISKLPFSLKILL